MDKSKNSIGIISALEKNFMDPITENHGRQAIDAHIVVDHSELFNLTSFLTCLNNRH